MNDRLVITSRDIKGDERENSTANTTEYWSKRNPKVKSVCFVSTAGIQLVSFMANFNSRDTVNSVIYQNPSKGKGDMQWTQISRLNPMTFLP